MLFIKNSNPSPALVLDGWDVYKSGRDWDVVQSQNANLFKALAQTSVKTFPWVEPFGFIVLFFLFSTWSDVHWPGQSKVCPWHCLKWWTNPIWRELFQWKNGFLKFDESYINALAGQLFGKWDLRMSESVGSRRWERPPSSVHCQMIFSPRQIIPLRQIRISTHPTPLPYHYHIFQCIIIRKTSLECYHLKRGTNSLIDGRW